MPAICGGLGIIIAAPNEETTNSRTVMIDEVFVKEEENTTAVSQHLIVNRLDVEPTASIPQSNETNAPTETAVPPTQTPVPTNTQQPTNTPKPTNTAVPEPLVAVSASSANLRNGPGTSYETVGVLNEGDIVEVIAQTNDKTWYNVKLEDGTLCWMSASVSTPLTANALTNIRAAATIPAIPTVEVQPTILPTLVPTTAPPTAIPTPIPTAPTEPPPPPTAIPTPVPAAPTEPPPPSAPSNPTFNGGIVDPPWYPCAEGQIKANNNSGKYHVPSGEYYAKTYNNVTCFNTTSEADAAGFVRSKK